MLLVSDFKEREGLLYVWVYGGDRCAAYCCQNHISLLWFAVLCFVLLYMCCCVGFLYIGQNIHWSSVLCCSELRYFVLLYLCINTHLVGTTLLCCALWCHVVLYSTLSCFDVLCSLDARYIPGQNHITRLCSSSTAAIQTRAAYCCRHPAGPAISSPLSVSMSHKPSFSTDFSGFQPQFGRTYRPILVFQKETEDRVKISFMRGWDEKNNQERGTSAVWLNSPFSLIGRVGNTYPFCAPPLRFRSVHADECSWFDYLTVTGKFGGAQWRPNSNTSCNTKKGNRILDILPQRFNLENFFWQWFIAFSLTCMCQNTCVYRFGANQ